MVKEVYKESEQFKFGWVTFDDTVYELRMMSHSLPVTTTATPLGSDS
jgi:hypothetical protein